MGCGWDDRGDLGDGMGDVGGEMEIWRDGCMERRGGLIDTRWDTWADGGWGQGWIGGEMVMRRLTGLRN